MTSPPSMASMLRSPAAEPSSAQKAKRDLELMVEEQNRAKARIEATREAAEAAIYMQCQRNRLKVAFRRYIDNLIEGRKFEIAMACLRCMCHRKTFNVWHAQTLAQLGACFFGLQMCSLLLLQSLSWQSASWPE